MVLQHEVNSVVTAVLVIDKVVNMEGKDVREHGKVLSSAVDVSKSVDHYVVVVIDDEIIEDYKIDHIHYIYEAVFGDVDRMEVDV